MMHVQPPLVWNCVCVCVGGGGGGGGGGSINFEIWVCVWPLHVTPPVPPPMLN